MQVAVASTSKVNLEGHDDFTYLCRICAVKTHNIIPLFGKDHDDQHLIEKINKYLPIKVCNDDLLPAGVCEQCSNAVLAWHELVECCLQADVSFQNRLALSQKQGLSQPTPGISSNSDTALNENGIKSERVSEYLVRIVPAPIYTGFVISSTEAINKRTDTCHVNRQDTFKLLADVSTIYSVQQSETAKVQFMKQQFVHTDTEHANWIHYSKHNTSDKKQPLDYNRFVQTRNNCIDEGSHNRVVSEFPLQTIEDSIEDTNNSTETKTILNSPNSPVSTGAETAYAAYDALPSSTDKVIDRLEQNEFSDHSDTESFARLSESVFEAIEDTRDSIIDKPTDEIRVIEKCKKSKRTRPCPICGKVYTASSSYFYHMKHVHRQSKEHSCDVCGKKFGTRGDLEQHAAVHTAECKYACRSCDKKFRSRASRYIHEQIHEGVKNYECSTCGKCFRWRTHLHRHTLRHAADKKHECAVCGRGFSVHCDLLRHARTHAVGSYECEECRVKFAQIRYLKAHMRKKHSVTSTSDIG